MSKRLLKKTVKKAAADSLCRSATRSLKCGRYHYICEKDKCDYKCGITHTEKSKLLCLQDIWHVDSKYLSSSTEKPE